MEMKHRLSAVTTAVDDHAIAVWFQAGGTGNARGRDEESSHERCRLVVEIGETGDVLFGNDDDMRGRLRMDVTEGVEFLVFVDTGGRDASLVDLAEEAGFSHAI